MNKYYLVSSVCFIVGFGFLLAGIFAGDIETGVILIFPFFMGSGIYAAVGIVFIFCAMVLSMMGFMT